MGKNRGSVLLALVVLVLAIIGSKTPAAPRPEAAQRPEVPPPPPASSSGGWWGFGVVMGICLAALLGLFWFTGTLLLEPDTQLPAPPPTDADGPSARRNSPYPWAPHLWARRPALPSQSSNRTGNRRQGRNSCPLGGRPSPLHHRWAVDRRCYFAGTRHDRLHLPLGRCSQDAAPHVHKEPGRAVDSLSEVIPLHLDP